jgi:hypothetical protein
VVICVDKGNELRLGLNIWSMLSRSWRAASGASTGVFPRVTTCLGSHTALVGLKGRKLPVASQGGNMDYGNKLSHVFLQ